MADLINRIQIGNKTYEISGGNGSSEWGQISGNIADQTDLASALANKADTSDYLPLSGGSMTGQITLASSGYKTANTAGYSVDQYGNFQHQSNTNTHTWNIKNNSGTVIFSLNLETGAVTISTPLPIEQGGTGATTASDAWTALGGGAIGKKASLAASDIPNLSTDKLTSGTLPIGRGGTGNTTGNAATATKLATARNLYVALGTTYDSASPVTFDGSANKALPVSGTLPIARGGTGATTAANARTELGITAIATRPNYGISTTDLTDGTSALDTGKLYFVYE